MSFMKSDAIGQSAEGNLDEDENTNEANVSLNDSWNIEEISCDVDPQSYDLGSNETQTNNPIIVKQKIVKRRRDNTDEYLALEKKNF